MDNKSLFEFWAVKSLGPKYKKLRDAVSATYALEPFWLVASSCKYEDAFGENARQFLLPKTHKATFGSDIVRLGDGSGVFTQREDLNVGKNYFDSLIHTLAIKNCLDNNGVCLYALPKSEIFVPTEFEKDVEGFCVKNEILTVEERTCEFKNCVAEIEPITELDMLLGDKYDVKKHAGLPREFMLGFLHLPSGDFEFNEDCVMFDEDDKLRKVGIESLLTTFKLNKQSVKEAAINRGDLTHTVNFLSGIMYDDEGKLIRTVSAEVVNSILAKQYCINVARKCECLEQMKERSLLTSDYEEVGSEQDFEAVDSEQDFDGCEELENSY